MFGKDISEFSFILGRSKVDGVGVFATHSIKAGTILSRPYPMSGGIRSESDLSSEYARFCISINKQYCICPDTFRKFNIWWFANHSEQNNAIIRTTDGVFVAISDIQAGSEVTYNYNGWGEPAETKDHFYKNN